MRITSGFKSRKRERVILKAALAAHARSRFFIFLASRQLAAQIKKADADLSTRIGSTPSRKAQGTIFG